LPTWGGILKQLRKVQKETKKAPFDLVRRKYLKRLYEYTKRNTILYASSWTQPKGVPAQLLSIIDEEVQGFMEAISDLSGKELDIILHSPGGVAEATEALVEYLRSNFDHIRVIIPHAAMSAATMFACSANEIIMGKHSFIGPIDPQMIVPTRWGHQSIPTQAILGQFEMAKKECKEDPLNLGVWLPIIEQYGPALIKQSEHADTLSKSLVAEWLEKYMFAHDKECREKAKKIADKLSDHAFFKSHGRHIGRTQAKSYGLKIRDLELDRKLQDLVLSVFHATTHTFDGTNAVKIIENHLGTAFVKVFRVVAEVADKKKTLKPKRKRRR